MAAKQLDWAIERLTFIGADATAHHGHDGHMRRWTEIGRKAEYGDKNETRARS